MGSLWSSGSSPPFRAGKPAQNGGEASDLGFGDGRWYHVGARRGRWARPQMTQILTALAIVFHVIMSLAVIALVLLHSGKGGGLSDVFGGGMSTSNLGGSTIVERNLDRLTVVVGVLFGISTFVLTFVLA